MEDLISTMKTSAHVGQGSDIRELQVRHIHCHHMCFPVLIQLQAQLNQSLPNVPISRSSHSPGNVFDCPPPPASSWNDQPAQNAFLSSSPFTARLMAHAASQANQQTQTQNNQRASIPAPNTGSQSQAQYQNQNQGQGGQGQNGYGNGNGQEMDNRRVTRSSHKALSPPTDSFANDAFRPLYEKAEGKQKGFGNGRK